MDFTLSDEQVAIADLAGRILSEQLPAERLREIEAKQRNMDGDMRELKTDVKHILTALQRLEEKLDIIGHTDLKTQR